MIIDKVLPLVDRVCSHLLNGLSPKDKVTLSRFKDTMSMINERILAHLMMDYTNSANTQNQEDNQD